MANGNQTDMGGSQDRFLSTDWDRLRSAQSGDPLRRRVATGRIIRQYWRPAYAFIGRFLRAKGTTPRNEDVKDLTQRFFAKVVWDGRALRAADPARGRFRCLLQQALRNFLKDEYRRHRAKKRHPDGVLISLEGLPAADALEADHQTPEQAYLHTWACQLLDEVLQAVEAGCRRAGQSAHWEVFRRTVLGPILRGRPKPPLADLADELGLRSPDVASAMVTTVKRRVRAALQTHVRGLVERAEDVDDEIREIMTILGQPGARRTWP